MNATEVSIYCHQFDIIEIFDISHLVDLIGKTNDGSIDGIDTEFNQLPIFLTRSLRTKSCCNDRDTGSEYLILIMKELFKQLSLSGFLGHVEFDHLFKVIDKPLRTLIDERMFLSQLGFFLSENDSMFVRFILVKIS